MRSLITHRTDKDNPNGRWRPAEWCAYYSDWEETACFGWGPTEQDAINNLLLEEATRKH